MIKDYWIKIENKGYKLLSFNCPKVQDIIYSYFATKEEPNGWKVVEQKTKASDPKLWIEIAYIMLMDKEDFPTFDTFYNAVSKDNKTRQHLLTVIGSSVSDRQKDINEEKDVKKKIIHTTIFVTISILAMLLLVAYFMGLVSLNL